MVVAIYMSLRFHVIIEFVSLQLSHRESVEHVNSVVKTRFAHITYDKKLKVLESAVDDVVIATLFLNNCYTCLLGNQVSEYFNVEPPLLSAYLE